MILLLIRNTCWVSAPGPGTWALKTFVISRVIGVEGASLVTHNKPLSHRPECVPEMPGGKMLLRASGLLKENLFLYMHWWVNQESAGQREELWLWEWGKPSQRRNYAESWKANACFLVWEGGGFQGGHDVHSAQTGPYRWFLLALNHYHLFMGRHHFLPPSSVHMHKPRACWSGRVSLILLLTQFCPAVLWKQFHSQGHLQYKPVDVSGNLRT